LLKQFGAHAARLEREGDVIYQSWQCVARRWASGNEAELNKEFARYASRTLRCCGNKIYPAHTQRATQRAGEEGAEESSDCRSECALPRTRRAADQQRLTSWEENSAAAQI
jgi:hypothetical protein